MKQPNPVTLRSSAIALATAFALIGAVASAHADKVKLSTVKIKGTIKSSNGDEPGTSKGLVQMRVSGAPPKGLQFYVDVEIINNQKFTKPIKLRLSAPVNGTAGTQMQFRMLRNKGEFQIVSGDKILDRARLPLLLKDAEVHYIVSTSEFDTKSNPLSSWTFEVHQVLAPPPNPDGTANKIKDPIIVKVPCDPVPIPIPYPVPSKP